MKKLNYGIVTEIPVDAITLSAFNPRKFVDEVSLGELGRSLSDRGTLYPVIVQAKPGGGYELFIGGRRLRAATQLQLEKIPAFVVSGVDDREKLLSALTENLHREDLTPFEEAWAFLKLINDFKMSMQDIAKEIDREEPYVRKRLQMLSLPEQVQELLAKRRLSMSHIDALIGLKLPDHQVQFAEAAVKDSLSGDELTVLVQEEFSGNGSERHGGRPPQRRWRGEFNGSRLTLKILKMVGFLKVVAPGAASMAPLEQSQIRAALEKLIAAADEFNARIGGVKHQAEPQRSGRQKKKRRRR